MRRRLRASQTAAGRGAARECGLLSASRQKCLQATQLLQLGHVRAFGEKNPKMVKMFRLQATEEDLRYNVSHYVEITTHLTFRLFL